MSGKSQAVVYDPTGFNESNINNTSGSNTDFFARFGSNYWTNNDFSDSDRARVY